MEKTLRAAAVLCAALLSVSTLKSQNYCESNATGEVQSNIWTCYGTATRPTQTAFNGDSLVVKHTVSWGTSQNMVVDWSSSQMQVLSVRSGGKIGPAVNNNEIILPQDAIVVIYSGGSISPLSGNNSNHALIIGSICIWGKKCCVGNTTIPGPIMLNAQNPCGFVPLPVELLSFTGKTVDGSRIFNWQTAQEVNVSHYTLEESTNGNNDWKLVGVIPAKGSSVEVNNYNYSLTEFSQALTTSYRLSQVEMNGKSQSLKTINVTGSSADATVVTQTENGVNVFVASEVEKVTVNVCDLYGKVVYSQADISNNGNIEVNLSDLASGMYIVNVVNGADQSVMATQKVVLP